MLSSKTNLKVSACIIHVRMLAIISIFPIAFRSITFKCDHCMFNTRGFYMKQLNLYKVVKTGL